MEIRNLNTFLKVASLKNFTKAAAELGYSQPNVSSQITQLEQDVGAPLFDRVGKKVFLTAYGEALVPYASQIVSTSLVIENFAKSNDTLGGNISFGMTDSLSELVLEDAIASFHKKYPKVKLSLTIDTSAELEAQVAAGQLDTACLIKDAVPMSDWNIWYSVEVPVAFVANPDHILCSMEEPTLEDIKGSDLILMEASSNYGDMILNLMAAKNIKCEPFLRLQSASGAVRLMERDLFCSVLPMYSVKDALDEGLLKEIKFKDWSQTQHIQMLLHKNKVMTPQLTGLMNEFKTVLENILAEKKII